MILKETDIAEASFLTGDLFDTDRYPVNRRGTAAYQEVIRPRAREFRLFA
jgi:hypothetical protein